MTPFFNRSIRLLLLLVQILAPWVHAHAGRETGGFLHLPGLERFAAVDVVTAAPGTPMASDVIVGVQEGLELSRPVPGEDVGDPCLVSHFPVTYPSLPLQAGVTVLTLPPDPALDLDFRSGFPPRASPVASPHVT